MTTLLGLCGALRAASTNRKLLREAGRIFAPDEWIEGDLDLPLYNADVEARGMPQGVIRLADQIRAVDAVVISCPEYNKALTGVMKNALDWISRVKGSVLRDKPVAIMSAADGRAGGDRSQFSLRLALTPFRARVLPGPEVMVADSSNAFSEDGRLLSDRYTAALTELMGDLRKEIALRQKS